MLILGPWLLLCFVLVWTNVGGCEVQYIYINSEVLQ